MLLTNFGVMDGRDLLTDMSSIPTNPGVYSWYRRLTVDEVSPTGFRTTLNDRMKSNSILPIFSGEAGPFGISLGPSELQLTDAKKKITSLVAKGKLRRSHFAHALLVSSIFQPPMYVGKANGLRGRLKDHRDGKTDFAKRIAKHNLMPNELVVATGVGADNLIDSGIRRASRLRS